MAYYRTCLTAAVITTPARPVIAAQKQKKSPPRRNGNGLRQKDTRTQFTSRVELRQEQRRCDRG